MTDIMRNLVVSAVLAAVLSPCLVGAQQTKISAGQQQAVMEAGRRISAPVEFVLLHRNELRLTRAQVAAVEKLGAVLRDSAAARQGRMMREGVQLMSAPAMRSVADWEGAVDEAGIRSVMAKQSEYQAAQMIAMAKDRRAVAALLTPEQRAQLPQLQNAEMLNAARARER